MTEDNAEVSFELKIAHQSILHLSSLFLEIRLFPARTFLFGTGEVLYLILFRWLGKGGAVILNAGATYQVNV